MPINKEFQMLPFAPTGYEMIPSKNSGQVRASATRLKAPMLYDWRSASAFGDGDCITKASEGFLDLFGYSDDDLKGGCLKWSHLAPLQFGDTGFCGLEHCGLSLTAVEPFEKELSHKDGSKILVEIAPVILEFEPFRWFASIRPAAAASGQDMETQAIPVATHASGDFIGNCEAMQRVMQLVEMVAPTETSTLILGETGTGKELVARAIHQQSPRKDAPFITLNCAAIPAAILESELFGHEKGAFTGAQARRLGRFEMANGGTLFLDEVGDLPYDLQPKLLRALQERVIERLGGNNSIPVDVRIVAATNRDLSKMVAENLFRCELFYRLNVFPITTPALRDRGDDVVLLANHFTQHFAAKMGKRIDQISVATVRALRDWSWPGNVRELENFIERSVILSQENVLNAPVKDLYKEAPPAGHTEKLYELQRQHILAILRKSNGVVTKAAEKLGLCRTTLNALMIRLNIQRKDFI